MEKREYEIGETVETRCETCDVVRPQTVASTGAKNQITRVTCPRCGNHNRYKKTAIGAAKVTQEYTGQESLYHPADRYEKGEIIKHPSFGFGEVVNVIDSGKIEVLFKDRLRCLIHGRAAESLHK